MTALRNLRQFIRMQERKLALKYTDEHAPETVLSDQTRLNQTDAITGDLFHLLPLEQQLNDMDWGMDYIPTPRI